MCKDVETFGSGIRKIYELCEEQGVSVTYSNAETDFTIEFSRVDRNNSPKSGGTNGVITNDEAAVLAWLREDPNRTARDLSELSHRSPRSVDRVIASLRGKKLIERVGSKKTGYWKVLG